MLYLDDVGSFEHLILVLGTVFPFNWWFGLRTFQSCDFKTFSGFEQGPILGLNKMNSGFDYH